MKLVATALVVAAVTACGGKKEGGGGGGVQTYTLWDSKDKAKPEGGVKIQATWPADWKQTTNLPDNVRVASPLMGKLQASVEISLRACNADPSVGATCLGRYVEKHAYDAIDKQVTPERVWLKFPYKELGRVEGAVLTHDTKHDRVVECRLVVGVEHEDLLAEARKACETITLL